MIFKLLRSSEFYGVSETIEIAKGKNKLPTTLKQGLEQLKRKNKFK